MACPKGQYFCRDRQKCMPIPKGTRVRKDGELVKEGSLHKWFKGSKSKDGKAGWVNVKTGGTCASDEPGEGTPKCVSSSKRASMTKAERDSASRRKKAADPNQQQKSGAAKPTYVRTDAKKKMKESKDVMDVAKELTKASKMHKGQAEKLKKHAKDMKETKNCGCGQDPCITYGKKEEVDEACWKGYRAKGMKKKGGKLVPNCKPIGEAKVDKGRSDYGKASIRNYRRMGPGHGEPAMFDPENKRGKLIDKRREEHKSRRGVKGAKVPAYKTEEVVAEADKKGKGSGTKDACYHKVKASAKVWPSAYASGRLVQCRKKGAANYGNKSEEVELKTFDKFYDECWKTHKKVGMKKKGGKMVPDCRPKNEETVLEKVAAWQRKEGKNKSGGLNEKGRKSYERENPGSDLKAPQPEGGPRKRSFCARMGGMKGPMKDEKGRPTRKALALRKWKC